VALHVAADDGAVEHIEGGKQRRELGLLRTIWESSE